MATVRARTRRPMHIRHRRGRRAPQIPTRPRSAIPCPPTRVGFGIVERDVHDRMPPQALQRALRTARMTPVCARYVDPPVVVIAEIDAMRGLLEEDRRRHQQLRLRAGIVRSVGGPFRDRDMAGRFDEAAELGIRHRVPVHPEAVDGHAMRRRFFWIVVVGPHQKRTTRNPHCVAHMRIIRVGAADVAVPTQAVEQAAHSIVGLRSLPPGSLTSREHVRQSGSAPAGAFASLRRRTCSNPARHLLPTRSVS